MILQQHLVQRVAKAEQRFQRERPIMKLRISEMPEISVQMKSVVAHEPAAELSQSFIRRVSVFRHRVNLRRLYKREPYPIPRAENFEIFFSCLYRCPAAHKNRTARVACPLSCRLLPSRIADILVSERRPRCGSL